MEQNGSFPLLKLDLLSFEEVLKNLEPIELFHFSLISEFTYHAVKTCKLHLNKFYRIDVDIGDTLTTRVCHQRIDGYECISWNIQVLESDPFRRWDLKEQDRDFPVEDDVHRFKYTVDYIQKLFGISKIYGFFNSEFPTNFCNVLDWIQSRQTTPIVYSEVDLDGNDSDISDALNSLKFDLFKHINLSMTPSLDWVQTDIRVYEYPQVWMCLAYWVTLPRLLTMDCREMLIHEAGLTSLEVNRFLKCWIAGSNPKMRQLSLNWEDMDRNVVLDGLPLEEQSPELVRIYVNTHGDKNVVTGGTDIRRFNGVTATIDFSHTALKFSLDFQVWAD